MASRSLDDLTEDTQKKVEAWVAACKALGVELLVYCTVRDADEQAVLYAQGRTTPGPIVTKAAPWQSWHQYGRAVDAVPLKFGKPMWKYNANEFEWQIFASEAEKAGLEWAGKWKSFREYVHVQNIPEGVTLASAYREIHPLEPTT